MSKAGESKQVALLVRPAGPDPQKFCALTFPGIPLPRPPLQYLLRLLYPYTRREPARFARGAQDGEEHALQGLP